MTPRLTVTAIIVAAAATTGCTIAPAADGTPAAPPGDLLPPPGYGTLRQDQVTMSLRSRDLEVQVTPLEESVTRVTAPDTYERLSGIASAHRGSAPEGARLFLVSFFSNEAGVRFAPEEVQLLSRGFRTRPAAILPVTPTWGEHRLTQQRTEMAVYAFPPELDLEGELVLVYGLEETTEWSAILPRIQAERGRARARAGVGGSPPDTEPQPHSPASTTQGSRPYLEIFR